MMDFKILKLAVAAQFERMKKHDLFRTAPVRTENESYKDALWLTYLSSFPEGSNPIYKERTEHDCTACKQFIRSVGNCVAVIDGKLESIWDVKIPNQPEYQQVANALSQQVKSWPIDNVFFHYEKVAGTDKNFQQIVSGMLTWEHFFVNIPEKFVVKNSDIATKLSEFRSTYDVMARALKEISIDACETALDLIAQRSLYRGDEYKFALDGFMQLKNKYDATVETQRDQFVWQNINVHTAISKIRNTSIGSLLVDLMKDEDDLESIVNSFNAKTNAVNFKRPSSLVSKVMIEKAQKELADMGLVSALERRYANLTDITINNLLFANRQVKTLLSGDVFDELVASANKSINAKSFDKTEEISIAKFISDILPRVDSVEVLLENRHSGNMVSLIAPIDPTAGNLFKWDNKFSWSYAGEVADSIKERVKNAGGNVTGDFCNRLAWYNHDDLDIHLIEPNGYEIHFRNRGTKSPCGGLQDVDMNAGSGITREPVENIVYNSANTMREGTYCLQVHNFRKRESENVGFEVEVDFMGEVYNFAYDKPVRDNDTITVATFKYSRKEGLQLISSLPNTQTSKSFWGLSSKEFHQVNALMMSPNYWNEQGIGNKHYFFMLANCVNDGTARGFYNEFLNSKLDKHRKVFEIVGSKTKVKDSPNQLSGLGFSSTQPNTLICRVKGSFSRILKINF